MALSLRKLATTATRRAFHKRLNQTFFFSPTVTLVNIVTLTDPSHLSCTSCFASLRTLQIYKCQTPGHWSMHGHHKQKQNKTKKKRWQSSLILQNTLRRLMSWRRYAKLTAHAFMKGREQDDWSLPTWGSETSSDGGWATSLAFMSRHMNGSRVRTCERKFTNWERPVPSVLGNLCLEQNCSTLLSAPIYTSSCYFYINAPVLSLSITKEAERYSKWLGEGNSSANSAKLWSFSRRVAANMAAKEKKKNTPDLCSTKYAAFNTPISSRWFQEHCTFHTSVCSLLLLKSRETGATLEAGPSVQSGEGLSVRRKYNALEKLAQQNTGQASLVATNHIIRTSTGFSGIFKTKLLSFAGRHCSC